MIDKRRTPPAGWSGVRRLPGLAGRIPRAQRGAVVLTAAGSLGDLYPVLSIARAIEMAGLEARLALTPEDCEMARKWGLLATPVGPSQAEMLERLGVTRDDVTGAVLRDPSPLINDVLLPLLPSMVAQLEELAQGASCVAGTTLSLAAPLAAERLGLAYVPLILQPFMLLSALDGPKGRRLGPVIPAPERPAAQAWNRAYLGLARHALSARHARRFRDLRARLGLPPHRGTPLVDPGGPDVPVRLGLWSPRFAPRPADAPPELEVVGFPPAPEGELPLEVRTWLDAGPPPLVVTLGSVAQGLGGARFWTEAVAMARAMGLRAVLLHGEAEVPPGPELLPLRYAAHAPLFPRAAAIVHHGGIGSTAEALRSGRPQLVVPVGGDQPDNAARLVRLGVAASLPIGRFTAKRAHTALAALLDRFDYATHYDRAEAYRFENGAGEAALHLAKIVLERSGARRPVTEPPRLVR